MPDVTTEQLTTAVAITSRLAAAVGADQWGLRTPCENWTVRDLVDHLTAGNNGLARALGIDVTSSEHDDPAAAYAESGRLVLAACSQPGALDRIVTVPFGTVPATIALHLRITDTLVHGWDLARATGQQTPFPADLAEQEIGWAHSALAQLPPGSTVFAPPKPAARDAPAIDRLAALLGRDVSGTQ